MNLTTNKRNEHFTTTSKAGHIVNFHQFIFHHGNGCLTRSDASVPFFKFSRSTISPKNFEPGTTYVLGKIITVSSTISLGKEDLDSMLLAMST